MSEKQKAASLEASGGRAFAQIAPIFDDLPDRFTTAEVCKKARLKGQAGMWLAISTLERAFRCNRNANGVWIKPSIFQLDDKGQL